MFFVFSTLILLVFSIDSFRRVRFGFSSRRWIPIRAKVLISEVSEIVGEDSPIYTPRIEYQYLVDGKVYRGKNLFYGNSSTDRHSIANKYVCRFPKGSDVKIYYNPNRHEISVILKGPRKMSLGTEFLSFGALITFWSVSLVAILNVSSGF